MVKSMMSRVPAILVLGTPLLYIVGMKKTEQLKIKITLDEQAKLRARAHELGMTVSDYVRELIDVDMAKPEKIKNIISLTKQMQKSIDSLNNIISESSSGKKS